MRSLLQLAPKDLSAASRFVQLALIGADQRGMIQDGPFPWQSRKHFSFGVHSVATAPYRSKGFRKSLQDCAIAEQQSGLFHTPLECDTMRRVDLFRQEIFMMPESAVLSNDSLHSETSHPDLLKVLASATAPMTVAELSRKLPSTEQSELSVIEADLQRLIQQQVVFRFAPYRGKADRFWNRSPDEYALHLLSTETAGKFSTKNELIKQFRARIKGFSEKRWGDLIQQLVNTGQLHTGRFLGNRTQRYSSSPFGPEALLDNAIQQIAKRCSISVDQVRQLVNASPQVTETNTDVAGSHTTEPTESSAALIMDAIALIHPGELVAGAIVPIVELRRALEFKLAGEAFDAALLQLERDAKVDLTVHPDPASLGALDRQNRMLTGDGFGKVYDMLIVRR